MVAVALAARGRSLTVKSHFRIMVENRKALHYFPGRLSSGYFLRSLEWIRLPIWERFRDSRIGRMFCVRLALISSAKIAGGASDKALCTTT